MLVGCSGGVGLSYYSGYPYWNYNDYYYDDIGYYDENPGSLEGIVTDSTTGLPVPNVNVTVGGITAVTDNYGQYVIVGLCPGDYYLTAVRAGYNEYSTMVTIYTATTTICDFQMARIKEPRP
jgi:hypothetical protein